MRDAPTTAAARARRSLAAHLRAGHHCVSVAKIARDLKIPYPTAAAALARSDYIRTGKNGQRKRPWRKCKCIAPQQSKKAVTDFRRLELLAQYAADLIGWEKNRDRLIAAGQVAR